MDRWIFIGVLKRFLRGDKRLKMAKGGLIMFNGNIREVSKIGFKVFL